MRHWDIYEITTRETPIHGVMLRGRLRKYAVEKDIDFLTENASDKENCVRFAVLEEELVAGIIECIESLTEDASVERVLRDVPNPVLSKLKVNDVSRYTL